MKKALLTLILFSSIFLIADAQDYSWTVTRDGIYRDGDLFYLRGQSWAKQTPLTYNNGTSNETEVKQKLSELSEIGVNTLRIYGSPDDSDWDGTSNFANLIKWIEEWNVDNPDGGDPNKAMYYLVQINPQDDESTISDLLPHNNSASFNRAIHDLSNPASVATLVNDVDNITGGSKYLLGYMIYHELNGSTKYVDWYNEVGASGIEDFMNEVADALHDTYAPGKLVTHTGDAKQPTADIYEQIENLDNSNGNVFANFDIIGFNLYISTTQMLSEGTYYDRIPQRRGFSVNSNRGWYIGETGASSDVAAETWIPAVNYTQSQGLANLQIMWQKSDELNDLIGFMLFTVQDNDLGATISDDMKQRGYFDVYGDKKFLYYAYPDVVSEISTNERYHYTDDHAVGVKIVDGSSSYTITFEFENKTSSSKDFFWSIYGDDGSTSQRFNVLEDEDYVTLSANSSTTITKTVTKPSSNDLFAVEAVVIEDLTPSNSYSYGRDHLLADAIGTVAGLNLNTGNLPDYGNSGGFTPNAPSNLSASGVTSSQIDLTWTDNSTVEDIFLLERSENGTSGWTQIASLSANSTSYSDNGLTAAKTYYYRILASNSTGSSVYSSVASATTKTDQDPGSGDLTNLALNKPVTAANSTEAANPEANLVDGSTGTRCSSNGFPQTLTVDLGAVYNISSTEVVCYNDRAYQFTIEASTTLGGSATTIVDRSSNTTPGTVASPITDNFTAVEARYVSITATGAASYTGSWVSFLEFRVFGSSSGGSSPTAPTAPSGLTASGVSTSQIDLTWSDNSSDEDNFIIEQSLNGVDTWTQITSLAANTTSYSNTGLTASKTYYYRISASNSAGNSSYSGIASATTKTETGTEVTVTYNPSDDAYVRGGSYDGSNYGTESSLVIKQGSVEDYFRKSYVQFDLSGEGYTNISSAVVRLYATTANSATITAYETTDSWGESSITWSSAPSEGTTLDAVSVTSSSQYYEWDITSLVDTEVSGDGVVSIVLYDAAADNLQTIFNSKEAGSNMPELVVTGTSLFKSTPSDIGQSQINSSIILYPNPVSDMLYVENLEDGYTNYSLHSVSGILIQEGKILSSAIDLTNINPGTFMVLTITGANKSVIVNTIVKK